MGDNDNGDDNDSLSLRTMMVGREKVIQITGTCKQFFADMYIGL